MADISLEFTEFKGLRNDKGQKFIGPDYFFDVSNFNYNDIVGANKTLMPIVTNNFNLSVDVDGIYEFKYLNQNNVLQTLDLAFVNGCIYKYWLSGHPELVIDGLSKGKVSCVVQNDKLFFVNGKDYPKLYDGTAVWDIEAPKATLLYSAGNLSGSYYYEVTYIIDSTEFRVGTRSNIITTTIPQKVQLDLPLGVEGTSARKIYRTLANGENPHLLATIDDNSTLTYVDNGSDLDLSLSDEIIEINKEMCRPYFITTSQGKLVAAKTDQYPTQVFPSNDVLGETLDTDAFIDISNIGKDNTAIEGMANDYGKIIIGTALNIFSVDFSADTAAPVLTRANVGVKDGYSMCSLPLNEAFPGGVMFVSTLNDVRLFNGNYAQPIATSLDNLKTDNWAQVIRNTLKTEIRKGTNFYAMFYDYKYHLIVGESILIFDIRTLGWSKYRIKTDSYQSIGNVFGVINNFLYLGQKNNAIIEVMYADIKYRGEECRAYIKSPQLMVSDKLKYFSDLFLSYCVTTKQEILIEVMPDGDETRKISQVLTINGGAYNQDIFDSNIFQTAGNNEDYKVLHLNLYARWIDYTITVLEGMFLFRGYKLVADAAQ
jgi:hypothetical protein